MDGGTVPGVEGDHDGEKHADSISDFVEAALIVKMKKLDVLTVELHKNMTKGVSPLVWYGSRISADLSQGRGRRAMIWVEWSLYQYQSRSFLALVVWDGRMVSGHELGYLMIWDDIHSLQCHA